MRRLFVVMGAVLALGFLGGCVTAEQREQAIEMAATSARDAAYDSAYDLSIKAGLSEASAKDAADKAGELAYRKAREEAEKRIPPADGGGLGKLLLGLFYGLVQVGVPLLQKGKAA